MQDIREYPGVHSVAPSRYPRAGASKSYHSSSPGPGHDFRDDHDNDDEHAASLTGSAQQSSDPDEAVFEAPSSQQSSPGTSHHPDDNDDEMSEFPPDPPIGEALPEHHQQDFSSPYTPHNKIRSPFRNPSSVRAMQMDTTPPHLTPSPSSQRYSITAPSRNGTSRSMRSSHSAIRSPSKLSPVKKLKKEYPLVLLHVTLLPIPIPYSPAVMESVLPPYILENWKLLRQKATQTVLDRGILIPHPKEDYDLLEERLLESLELKTPRILKCGHFHLSPEEEADIAGPDGYDSDEDDDAADGDICDDCGRRIRDGRFGSGTGSKRWDIKLFAANGLMRAGAWGAAWREMERVDVEIVPWMDEELKRQVELRSLEEAEAYMTSPSQHAAPVNHSRGDAAPNPSPSPGMDEARMREIYGDNFAQAFVGVDELLDIVDNEINVTTAYPPTSPLSHQNHQQTEKINQRHQEPQTQSSEQQQRRHPQQEIPLPTLLRNYIYLLISAQDGRNLAIGFLSFLVLLLALRSFTTAQSPLPPPPPMWKYGDAAMERDIDREWYHHQRGGQKNGLRRVLDYDDVPDPTSLVIGSSSGVAPPLVSISTASSSLSSELVDDTLATISIAAPNPNPSLSPPSTVLFDAATSESESESQQEE